MDSVTQKNNLLSMTGIDQTEENSIAILELQTKTDENTIAISELETKTDEIEEKTTVNTDDITALENMINPFVQNVAPYIVLKNDVNQTIDGVKTFLNPIFTNGFKPLKSTVMGHDFYEPITFNPDGKYKMTFDVHKGLDVSAPITLVNNALFINNISGLQDALNSANEVQDRSITTTKIALNTILGDNFNKAISFSTTGDIGATIGTFTQCVSVICQAGSFRFLNTAPLLNVSIPCFPKIITGTREFNLHFHSINDVSYLPYIYPFDFTIHSIAIRTPQKTDSFDYSFYSMNFLFTLITTNPIPGFADEYTYVNFGGIMVGTSTVFVLPNPLQIKAGVKFFLKATNVIGYVEWLNFEIHGFQH